MNQTSCSEREEPSKHLGLEQLAFRSSDSRLAIKTPLLSLPNISDSSVWLGHLNGWVHVGQTWLYFSALEPAKPVAGANGSLRISPICFFGRFQHGSTSLRSE